VKHLSFDFADRNLVNKVVEPDQLNKLVPNHERFLEGVQEMRTMQREIAILEGVRAKVTRQSGFTADARMQRIATIPLAVKVAIEMVDPAFFKDRAKVYRFLMDHPEYDTRSKID